MRNLREAAGDRPRRQSLGGEDAAEVSSEPAARARHRGRGAAAVDRVHDLPGLWTGTQTADKDDVEG